MPDESKLPAGQDIKEFLNRIIAFRLQPRKFSLNQRVLSLVLMAYRLRKKYFDEEISVDEILESLGADKPT